MILNILLFIFIYLFRKMVILKKNLTVPKTDKGEQVEYTKM
jgi:hypothetical protein